MENDRIVKKTFDDVPLTESGMVTARKPSTQSEQPRSRDVTTSQGKSEDFQSGSNALTVAEMVEHRMQLTTAQLRQAEVPCFRNVVRDPSLKNIVGAAKSLPTMAGATSPPASQQQQ